MQRISGVAAIKRVDNAVVNFPRIVANFVKKPTVVSHDNKRTRVICPSISQVLGQPRYALDVEVVGRFVEHHNIELLGEKRS